MRLYIFKAILYVFIFSLYACIAVEDETPLSEIPFPELINRCEELPADAELWTGLPAAQALGFDTEPNVVLPVLQQALPFDQSDLIVNEILVMFPLEYFDDCNKDFPVLYYIDGQFAFDDDGVGPLEDGIYLERETAIDEAMRNEHISERFAEGVGNFIVVALPTIVGPSDLSTRFSRLVPNGPTRAAFDAQTDFLINTVKPTIDAQYRTLSDRNNTFLRGTSLGSIFVSQLLFSNPEFSGNIIGTAGGGPNSLVSQTVFDSIFGTNLFTSWNPENATKLASEGKTRFYIQYAIDALRGFDASPLFSGYIPNELAWLTDNGFAVYDGTNFDTEDQLVIVEPLSGLRGDTHNPVTENVALIDGLLKVQGLDPITVREQPFHLIQNPDAPIAPEIIADQTNGTDVRLRLSAPSYLGYDFAGKNTSFQDILQWKVYTGIVASDDTTTFDDGIIINAQNIDELRSSSNATGEIRNFLVNDVRTTDLEITMSNLQNNTNYVFQVAIETLSSDFEDARSESSEQVVID